MSSVANKPGDRYIFVYDIRLNRMKKKDQSNTCVYDLVMGRNVKIQRKIINCTDPSNEIL